MSLVWELTSEIKNWLTPNKITELNAGWCLQGGGHSDLVINDLVSMLERPDVHYEGVLGYLEFGSGANALCLTSITHCMCRSKSYRSYMESSGFKAMRERID